MRRNPVANHYHLVIIIICAAALAPRAARAAPSTEEEAVFLEMQEQRRKAKEEMERLAAERQAVEALKAEVLAKLEELRALQRSLDAPLDAREAEAKKRRAGEVRALSRMMAAMRPEEAARLLEKLDGPLAVELVRALGGAKAGALLAKLPAERAAELARALVEGKS